jgi:hypothetical protein
VLLRLADGAGTWSALGRVGATRHSRAVLEIDNDRVEVNLLGVRVHGLPAGATDLSVLDGARVIATGRCVNTCIVERMQVVEIGTATARERPIARLTMPNEYDLAA